MDSMTVRIQFNSTSFNLPTHHRFPFTNPISPSSSTISFKSLKPKTLFKPLTSSSLHLPSPTPQTPHSQTQNPLFTLLKTTCITLVTTTLFLSRLTKPSLASQPLPTTQSTTQETVDTDEEKERVFEDYLSSHPDDARALKGLMEVKIKTRKFEEAIGIINRLIEVEPFEKEWPLMKAHVCNYSGDIESAKLGFEEVLSKDPFVVEAYHGLVMVASQSDEDEMEGVVKRIESAVEQCKKAKKKEELRDFKLLLAQVRVVEGKYVDALKVYQELVKEEPRDFRPYLCQGIIYTLLKKPKEADTQFEKYRRLVPKGHPYARYFEDNMNATKMFSQMAENQGFGSNR